MGTEFLKKIIKERLNSGNLKDSFCDGTDFYEVSVIVKNNGQDLAEFLNGKDLRHLGNFVFRITMMANITE